MAGFGRSNSLSINTGGGLLYVLQALVAAPAVLGHGRLHCHVYHVDTAGAMTRPAAPFTSKY